MQTKIKAIGYELCSFSRNNSFEGIFLQYKTFLSFKEGLDDYEMKFLEF